MLADILTFNAIMISEHSVGNLQYLCRWANCLTSPKNFANVLKIFIQNKDFCNFFCFICLNIREIYFRKWFAEIWNIWDLREITILLLSKLLKIKCLFFFKILFFAKDFRNLPKNDICENFIRKINCLIFTIPLIIKDLIFLLIFANDFECFLLSQNFSVFLLKHRHGLMTLFYFNLVEKSRAEVQRARNL